MDMIVTGGGGGGGLCGARDDEMTKCLLCPSNGKGQISAPKPPNFFFEGTKVVQNLRKIFFQKMS